MIAAVELLAGVVGGGLVGLFSGLMLQSRVDRRRLIGACRLIAAELRVNAGEIAAYYVQQQLEREGSRLVHAMPVKVGVEAWRLHGIELVHLDEPDLVQTILRLYTYIDRFERDPTLLRPDVHERMKEAAQQLEQASKRTWPERWVLRV